ncbi:MAG: TMEM175 family protein [Anaerolineae bacterium]
MPNEYEDISGRPPEAASLARLETLGDAIFGFSLTLLALDLRLPDVSPNALAQGMLSMLPRLLIFMFTFLVVAQQWDVHQRTVSHITHADSLLVWLYLLSLMFVVLMPASSDILARYPLQPLSLAFFGANTALLCLASWGMWRHASHNMRLLDGSMRPELVRLIDRLWLYPAVLIVLTMPLGFVSVYPVYVLWFLMPVISYSYSTVLARRKRQRGARHAHAERKAP